MRPPVISVVMANLRKPVRKRKNNATTCYLPEELLELIFECLWRPRESILGTNVDFNRVGAVCKKWRIVSSRVWNKKQSEDVVGPLIFVPPSGRKKSRLSRLYDFSSNITQQLLLPRTLDRLFINSWNDWLVTVENRNIKCNKLIDSDYHINFYNMFSGAYIKLPQSSFLLSLHGTKTFMISKAIASCAPSDPNCIIMAIRACTSKLAFCNVGAEKWGILENKSDSDPLKKMYHEDLIYFKDEFYVVTNYGNLFVCDLKCLKLKAVTCLDFADAKWESNFLVEISSDLFRIVRHTRPGRRFTVYKMDFGKQDWQMVTSLGEGNSIFISQNMTMSISTNKYLRVQSDCIYYHEDYYTSGVRDKGIEMFDMKTNFVEYTFSPSRLWSSLFWINKV